MQAEFKWGSRSNVAAHTKPVRQARNRRSGTGLFAAALCESYDESSDVEEMCDDIKAQLNGETPDLALVFASRPKYPHFENILPTLHDQLGPNVLIGCSGSGVIGAGLELETGPGLSVLAATCDTDDIHPFAFTDKQACGRDVTPESLADTIGVDPEEYEDGLMLVFVDPLTVSTEYALSMLDSAFPTVMKVGALVSGGQEYGENRVLIGEEARTHGAVGLLMKRDFAADAIISGSEIPIGESMVITKALRNEIHRLDDHTPLTMLEDVFVNADPLHQLHMTKTLVVGLESGDVSLEPDYVMRNIMSMDQETGSMKIGDLVEEGQSLRFHIRDGDLASQRLKQNISNYASHVRDHGQRIDALLCFNSVARGTRMFEEAHHDAEVIAEHFGNIPIAGFFSNGEIASKRGGFSLLGEEEFSTRVMGYSDTLVTIRDLGRESIGGS